MNLSAGESANSSSAITASEARPTAVVHRPVPSPNAAPAVHPPKVELFDISERTNTDPKGFVRPVDVYLRRPWGLYMARPADHRQFHYLESWLLPSVGLRASIFHFNEDFKRDQS